jgi:hypothetical protein
MRYELQATVLPRPGTTFRTRIDDVLVKLVLQTVTLLAAASVPRGKHMKISDFRIGKKFMTSTGQCWRCTDVGQRTILAIEIEPDRDPAWYIGPPYIVPEVVFNEKEISLISRSMASAVRDDNDRYHPGFPHEVTMEFMQLPTLMSRRNYKNRELLDYDRVDDHGEVWHPYAAHEVAGTWVIKTYNVFRQTFSEVSESVFVRWETAVEAHYRAARQAKDIGWK